MRKRDVKTSLKRPPLIKSFSTYNNNNYNCSFRNCISTNLNFKLNFTNDAILFQQKFIRFYISTSNIFAFKTCGQQKQYKIIDIVVTANWVHISIKVLAIRIRHSCLKMLFVTESYE